MIFEILLLVILIGMLIYAVSIIGTDRNRPIHIPGFEEQNKQHPMKKNKLTVVLPLALVGIMFFLVKPAFGIDDPIATAGLVAASLILSVVLQAYIANRQKN